MDTIIVLGGGAAGFFSAIHNKQTYPKAKVIIIEKGKQVLGKVKISGGGRCNVTHACFDPRELSTFYPRGAKELLGLFYRFQPKDTIEWFQSRGVKLKVESDNRVFPVSDSSQTIIDCLVKTAETLGVKIWTQCQVTQVSREGKEFCLILNGRDEIFCQKLVLATGSNPQGYELAQQLGHHVHAPIPSLFTLKLNAKGLTDLMGVSVPNASVWLKGHGAHKYKGGLLITHWGMSGPSIIKLSAWCAEALFHAAYKAELVVDWVPEFTHDEVMQKIEHYRLKFAQKRVAHVRIFQDLPSRLWQYLLGTTPIASDLTWQQINRRHKEWLCQMLKASVFSIVQKGVFKEEFVTCGGVSLKEIDFKTMESKCCPGLHIVGELLHIDGITGGFNFQNAWTTGYISGQSALDRVK